MATVYTYTTTQSEGIQVEYYSLQCTSEWGLICVAVVFGYKVILQISGMVLAILTRKVEVKGLNESWEVQMVMIITTPMVMVALVLRLTLSDYLNVVGMLCALGISLAGGTTLGIIFLPKVGAYNPHNHSKAVSHSIRTKFRNGCSIHRDLCI